MSESIVLLVVELSRSCHHHGQQKIKENLESALYWLFADVGKEESSLKGIMQVSSNLMVIWVEGTQIAELLVETQNFAVSGPLTADFMFPRDMPSLLLVLTCNDENCTISLMMRSFKKLRCTLERPYAQSMLMDTEELFIASNPVTQ